jgi:hypothetical protein
MGHDPPRCWQFTLWIQAVKQPKDAINSLKRLQLRHNPQDLVQ